MVKQLLHKASQTRFRTGSRVCLGGTGKRMRPLNPTLDQHTERCWAGNRKMSTPYVSTCKLIPGIVLQNIRTSAEFSEKERNHPFFHFNTRIDAAELIRRNALTPVKADARYLTNWFGVRVDPDVCPPMLKGRAGEIDPLPIPGNWHADMENLPRSCVPSSSRNIPLQWQNWVRLGMLDEQLWTGRKKARTKSSSDWG